MKPQYSQVLPRLKTLLPSGVVNELGRTVRFIRRVRRIEAPALLWALVLSRFEVGKPGFSAAQRNYTLLTEKQLGARPFQLRLMSHELERLMAHAFELAVKPWRSARKIDHPLRQHFADIVVVDSTLVRVDDLLRRPFKGLRQFPAQIKVLLAISAFGSLPLFAKLGAGVDSDAKIFPALEGFRKGVLWIFDRGFLAFDLFGRIGTAQQFFLCPIKSNTNAIIVAIHQGPAWARKRLRSGAKLTFRDLVPRGKAIGRTWDFDVLLTPPRTGLKKATTVRLLVMPDRKSKQRGYFTNLGRTPWTARRIRELYRLRWQVELTFKELKQDLNLETVPTKNANAALVFVWASLLALALSRTIATCVAGLHHLVGLASPVRPTLISRGLRSHVRTLAYILRLALTALRGTLQLLSLMLDALVCEARCSRARSDTFSRLAIQLAHT